jgi:hypothetical protein
MELRGEKKTGARIILGGVVLIAIALVCSNGWGAPVDLWLYSFLWEYEFDPDLGMKPSSDWIVIRTKYVLGVLVAVVGYGVARFFSLIPPIFARRNAKQSSNSEPAAEKWE